MAKNPTAADIIKELKQRSELIGGRRVRVTLPQLAEVLHVNERSNSGKKLRGDDEVMVDIEQIIARFANHPDQMVRAAFSAPEDPMSAALRDAHAVDVEVNMVPAGQLVLDLELSLDEIFGLAGLGHLPPNPDMLIDADVVCAEQRRRREVLERGEGGQLVSFDRRSAHVAGAGRTRRHSTAEDRLLLDELFAAQATILRNPIFRPDLSRVEKVTNEQGRVSYLVPSLLDPNHMMKMDPTEYRPLESDVEATFPHVDLVQERNLVSKMSLLSDKLVPRYCVNCENPEQMPQGLRSKFWNLIDGLPVMEEQPDGSKQRVLLRFHLPFRKQETERLFQEIGLPTDHLEELKFRKTHKECGLIVHEVMNLVASPQFDGVDWFDPEVRALFIKQLGELIRAKLPEIEQLTEGRADRALIRLRTADICRVIFNRIDKDRADRAAAVARQTRKDK